MARSIDEDGMTKLFNCLVREVILMRENQKPAVDKKVGGVIMEDLPVVNYWVSQAYLTSNPNVVINSIELRKYK